MASIVLFRELAKKKLDVYSALAEFIKALDHHLLKILETTLNKYSSR